jgi:hypothetical protein
VSPTGRRIAVLAALCVLAVVARVSWSGVAETRRARMFEQEGRWHEASVHYGRAIHMYLPGSPIPGRAGERLLALGAAAEERGEPLEARFCYEELRSGFLSVRSFYQPGQRFIDAAEEGLVPLMLADDRGNWPERTLPAAEREAQVRGVLAEREDPSLFWVLVMGLGYLAWLGAAAMAILQGLPRHDRAPIRWPVVLRWGLISAVGYGLWLAGVAFA